MLVQPIGDLHPFMIHRMSAISAAGADDDGSAIGRRSGIDVYARDIDGILPFGPGDSPVHSGVNATRMPGPLPAGFLPL